MGHLVIQTPRPITILGDHRRRADTAEEDSIGSGESE